MVDGKRLPKTAKSYINNEQHVLYFLFFLYFIFIFYTFTDDLVLFGVHKKKYSTGTMLQSWTRVQQLIPSYSGSYYCFKGAVLVQSFTGVNIDDCLLVHRAGTIMYRGATMYPAMCRFILLVQLEV